MTPPDFDAESNARPAPSSARPLFVGGMFKSGTSLLRAMLGNHSAVASGLETYWFEIDWANRDAPETRERFRLIAAFFELTEAEQGELIARSGSAEMYLDALMALVAAREGKPRWAEKTPGNVRHVDRIRAHWPAATVLHIIRDPRDIFASLREAKKWDTVEVFMGKWASVMRAVEAFRAAELLEAGYVELRYETLVTDPEGTMRAVCAATDLPFEPAVAAFDGKADDFAKVSAATGKESTTLARLATPLTRSRVGIWRDILRAEEERALSEAAAAAGLGAVYERICAATPDAKPLGPRHR